MKKICGKYDNVLFVIYVTFVAFYTLFFVFSCLVSGQKKMIKFSSLSEVNVDDINL